jgi:hypothetical protein
MRDRKTAEAMLTEHEDAAAAYQHSKQGADAAERAEYRRTRAAVLDAMTSYIPQPIKTAPRDGTRILVHFKEHGWLACSWEYLYETGDGIWYVDDFKHGPYAVRGYNDGDDTVWMPLPAAPQKEDKP